MSGNVAGGKKASATNRKRYGEGFYKHIGSLGGKKSKTGGFAANRELARIAGAKGGRVSTRRQEYMWLTKSDYNWIKKVLERNNQHVPTVAGLVDLDRSVVRAVNATENYAHYRQHLDKKPF